ncbi:hypothetical protein F5148DRAFT_1009640 [Russula earlei]|uniref:Uncharacterized protein n=1 Tax=Russula earlei TaxID=71964 RepID=A0ACC0UI51_9AGAM|nr:hypothetical protein F5148DRAFT_1009640 [Russula earlei]
MPHKRAKRSVREQQKKERGADLAPSSGNSRTGISTERIPKSAARVLDAARIHAEYRQKRARLRIEEGGAENDIDASKAPPVKKRRTDAAAAAAAAAAETEKGQKALALAEGRDRRDPNGAVEIQPGESLKHFDRRVEDYMRPLVRSAMRASAATERKERNATSAIAAPAGASPHGSAKAAKTKTVRQPSSRPPPSSNARQQQSKAHAGAARRDDDDDDDRPKEFATTSSAAPRRLNDVVTAPPALKSLPRGAKKHRSRPGKAKAVVAGVLSMAQRAMMETERENAIRRYREMRGCRRDETYRTLTRDDGPALS